MIGQWYMPGRAHRKAEAAEFFTAEIAAIAEGANRAARVRDWREHMEARPIWLRESQRSPR